MVGIIVHYHGFCHRAQDIDKLLRLVIEHIHTSVIDLTPDISIFSLRYLADSIGI